MKNDWRLTNQDRYLQNKKLIRMDFAATEDNDHAHCAFCWSKFGELENMLHSGYCVVDENRWICEKCFSDFKKRFQWAVVPK